jgi:peptidoglycan-associated lipoprotein
LNSTNRVLTCLVLLIAVVGFAGCSKKKNPPLSSTPPPLSGPAPTAQLTATPTTITAGDQVVLSWRTVDATSVSIDGIGDVPSSGVKTVTPTESTSYHLIARGDGGSADATARVTVNPVQNAVAVPNDMTSSNLTEEEQFKANVQDIFFDYDSYEVTSAADQASLSKSAAYLAQHAKIKVLIGGYCDERGSNEYNLTLGQSRANSAKQALVQAGVAADRIRVVSYGKEKPFCTESTEECWQQNRRAGFSIDR